MSVETASKATISYKDELWIGRSASGGGSPVFTQILGIETVAMPARVPEDVDVTHQQSPGRSRETIPGLLPVAEFSQDMQFWPTDPGQMIVDELADLTEAGTPEDMLLEMVVGDIRRTYRGHVTAYTPSGTVGDKRMAAMSAKLFERRTDNPRVPEAD